MNITNDILAALKEHAIFLDEYFILYSKYKGENWLTKYKAKDFAYNKLIALGFLNKSRGLSALGTTVMDEILQSEQSYDHEEIVDEFKTFWKTYPASDKFRHWPKTRTFRGSERKAKRIYTDIIEEGEYSPDDLLRALNSEINMRSKNSVKDNDFKWMKDGVNWLENRLFEAILQSDQVVDDENEIEHGQNIV